jgi:sugar phosphate permease
MVSLDMKGKWPPRWPCTVVQKTHTAAYRWRWIFLLEGIVTVILGISCFFLLIDSPALSGKWLEPDEIRFLELQRFIKDGGKFQEERANFRWKDLKMVLCNWRLYMQAYILLCISACSYGMLHEEKLNDVTLTQIQEPSSLYPQSPRAWGSLTPTLNS